MSLFSGREKLKSQVLPEWAWTRGHVLVPRPQRAALWPRALDLQPPASQMQTDWRARGPVPPLSRLLARSLCSAHPFPNAPHSLRARAQGRGCEPTPLALAQASSLRGALSTLGIRSWGLCLSILSLEWNPSGFSSPRAFTGCSPVVSSQRPWPRAGAVAGEHEAGRHLPFTPSCHPGLS